MDRTINRSELPQSGDVTIDLAKTFDAEVGEWIQFPESEANGLGRVMHITLCIAIRLAEILGLIRSEYREWLEEFKHRKWFENPRYRELLEDHEYRKWLEDPAYRKWLYRCNNHKWSEEPSNINQFGKEPNFRNKKRSHPVRVYKRVFQTGDRGLIMNIDEQIERFKGQHGFRFVEQPEDHVLRPIRDRLETALGFAFCEIGLHLKPSAHKGPEKMYVVPSMAHAEQDRWYDLKVTLDAVNPDMVAKAVRNLIRRNVGASRHIWRDVTEDSLRHPFRGEAPGLGKKR